MFQDRQEAGRKLGAALSKLSLSEPVIMAIPRGGIIIAHEVSRALRAPLDLVAVKKVRLFPHLESDVGAVAAGGVEIHDEDFERMLDLPADDLSHLFTQERREVDERVKRYRGRRTPGAARGRDIVLVDDGMASGLTARAAVKALRAQGPRRVVLGVPVASRHASRLLRDVVDLLVCLDVPEHFFAIEQWYRDYEPVNDSDIMSLLGSQRPAPGREIPMAVS